MKGMKVKFLSNNQQYNIDRIGYFTPEINYCNELKAGEIGFINSVLKYPILFSLFEECETNNLFEICK